MQLLFLKLRAATDQEELSMDGTLVFKMSYSLSYSHTNTFSKS